MKHRIIFAVLMSFTLSLIISAWITYVNIGMHPDFVRFWMNAWALAWPAAGIISFIAGPFLHSLAYKIANKI
ncbi:hypothetical protein MSP8886_00281 [Marinomonas spartinae]|uniref:DUF2798 domain-containing protein n=1 Tax=Marinomonas spartinae TaxID=1792290 RepID=A0A1A8T342_9GAMM|nr:DUF2798 domain-containing protein [Marinomonas spartinae]SBS25443.1 hypothetical protein MSP8886_00281 [Marinomonas spartinae]